MDETVVSSKRRAPERLERIADWFSSIGLGFGSAERLIYWWKHFGFLRTLTVALAVFVPVFKYALFPALCSRAAKEVAQGYGVELEVDDWSGTLLDLKGTAERVRINNVVRADAITLDFSLWGMLKTGRVLNEVVVERPTIYLERQLSGRWNWEEVLESGALRRGPDGDYQLASMTGDAADIELRAPRVKLKEARIQWVENVPGGSGGGIVESRKAAVYLDDVDLTLNNVFVPRTSEPPFTFVVEGRIADGRISMRGTRRGGVTQSAGVGVLKASTRAKSEEEELAVQLYLENVGAGAIATIVHRAHLVPRSGTVTGKIDLVMRRNDVRCATELTLNDVRYAFVAEDDPGLRKREEESVRKVLTELRINDRVVAECHGTRDEKGYRIADAVQYAITKEAVKDAPPVVRAVATLDERQLTAPEDDALTSDELTTELRAMGVPEDVQTRVEQAGAITRGVKRVKEGFRRLVR